MKYIKTTTIEAEQFLPEKDQIPAGVHSDGPHNPASDSRSSWVSKTEDGMVYLNSGDYIVTESDGRKHRVIKEEFEKDYKPETPAKPEVKK